MTDILASLAAPFPPDAISWRLGSTTKDKSRGMALAYIDARDVQDRLDQVCGMNWAVRHPWSVGTKLACEIGIKVGDEWIWRGDGAGDSDVEAEKGAFSDSFKRAGVRWGIGRYLYDIKSPWVALTPQGNSHVIAEGEYAKLRAALGGTAQQAQRQSSAAPQQTDEQYVEQASAWMRDQTDAFKINETWSLEFENFTRLPLPLQTKLTAVRDEVLAKWAKPKTEGLKTPSQVDEDFKIVADQIKRQIDDALDTVTVRDILDGKALADLAKHSKSAASFLRDRADKKLGIIMQGRKAA